MIERVDGDPAADQLRGDVGLQVGIGQHEVGRKGENAVDIGAGERGHARLFATDPGRANRKARDPDNARVLAQ